MKKNLKKLSDFSKSIEVNQTQTVMGGVDASYEYYWTQNWTPHGEVPYPTQDCKAYDPCK